MASNSSLGAAMGGEGTADKIPGRSLRTLVLGRLGYPTGAGAPRLVCADWRGEADRLYGREREIQVALRDPHNASRDCCIPAVKYLLLHGAAYDQPNKEGVTPLAAARALLPTKTVPSGIDGDALGLDHLRNLYRQIDIARYGGNAPALNALWDDYLWQLLRAWISVRGPQVDTSARHAVASTPELSRQVVAFLVGDPSIYA